MKQLFCHIIFAISLFTFGVSAIENTVPEDDVGYYQDEVPVLCSTNDQVMEDLKKSGYQLISLSLGRRDADPTQEAVFSVSYYVNPELNSSATVLNVPASANACILYLTFDLMMTVPTN
jgi:hypothetical protein